MATDEDKLGKAYDHELMRRLLQFIRPYHKQVIAAILALLAAAFFQLAGPKLTQIGIDKYISSGNIKGLYGIILLFLLVVVLNFFTRFAQVYLMEWIGQNIMFDLRNKIFSHLEHLPLTYFNRNPVGRLITRVTTDVEALNEMFTSGLVAVFGDVVTLTGIIIFMAYLNWRLTIVTLAVVPFIFLGTILFKLRVRDAFRAIRTRIARINAYLQENIGGMAVVQLFGREQKNFARFDQYNADHLDAYIKTIFYFALFYPFVDLMGALATALIIWYGGLKIITGALTFGGLVAFLQYSAMFFRPISDLSEKYNIMQSAMAASERIFHVLDEKPETSPTQPSFSTPPKIHGAVEFSHVWFAYQHEDWILKDISLTIAPGEKIAVVGATGAGKTTIISLLGRFYDIQRGKILLDGSDLRDFSLQELRSQIGVVLQDVFLFAGTIADNIRLGNKMITDAQVQKAAVDVNLVNFIENLPAKFDTVLTERGSTLSVGQKQLLAFARAIAYNPAILVLDEATSSVDTETELLIQKALERLMENRTAIIIAHRLSTIQHVDKIIVMHKGEIREIGTHSELLAQNGLYHRLYQLQFSSEQRQTERLAG